MTKNVFIDSLFQPIYGPVSSGSSSEVSAKFFTVRNEVAARQYFHRPPGQTPPWWTDSPLGRHPQADTPRQTHIPLGRHPQADTHPLGRHLSRQISRPRQTPYAGIHTPLPSRCWTTPPSGPAVVTAVDSMHPTGMHSCSFFFTI